MFRSGLTKHQPQSVLAALAVLLFASVGAQGSGSPFVGLSGAWTGSGSITLASGAKENIRCRANYEVGGGGLSLKLDLRCSSDAFKFELQSSVSHNNGEVAGFWNELTNRVGGTIAGKASGDRIEVLVDGPIAAMLEISTRADKQSVFIQSPGSKMSEVAISLSRGTKQAALQ